MQLIECSSFILIKGKKILVEKRKDDKETDPGLVAIPGGRCEGKETMEETLFREAKEELGIIPIRFNYLCTLLHKSQTTEKVHYFMIDEWQGKIQNNEAEALFWIDFKDISKIDIEADRIATQEYFRHFGIG